MVRCFVASPSEPEPPSSTRTARRVLCDSLVLAQQTGADVTVVTDPSIADVVLFVERHRSEDDLPRVMQMPIYRDYRHKFVVHNGKDYPRALVPGLYPNLSERWAGILGCQGAPFLNDPNPFLTADISWNGHVERLASFFGDCLRKPIRAKLLSRAAGAAWRDISITETAAEFNGTRLRGDIEAHNELKRAFVLDLRSAKFALCPRGTGASTYRLFEAMQCGRAPVVISDGWARPPGPDWDSFAIFVAERHIDDLPRILRSREGEWEERGAKAQAAWRAFYSPERVGMTVVHQAIDVLRVSNAKRLFTSVMTKMYVKGPREIELLQWRLSRKLRRMLARQ